MSEVFSAKIETNGGDYWHDAHLGTCEPLARELCEEIHTHRRPRVGTKITTVSLYKGHKFVDSFNGDWAVSAQGLG